MGIFLVAMYISIIFLILGMAKRMPIALLFSGLAAVLTTGQLFNDGMTISYVSNSGLVSINAGGFFGMILILLALFSFIYLIYMVMGKRR